MLSDTIPAAARRELIARRRDWQPFDPADVSPDDRERCIQAGEAVLDYDWPPMSASLMLTFERTGDRSAHAAIWHGRRSALEALALAEWLEGEGRFTETLANGIWAICEESTWAYPAHMFFQRAGSGLPDVEDPFVDLAVGDTVSDLAWVDRLLGSQLDAWSPLLRPRIRHETQRRVLRPCMQRHHWWMGFEPTDNINNWNPWINLNWLTAVLLLEDDDEAALAAVDKILASLDRFVANYPPDGGCDEGATYWSHATGALFQGLETLHSASGGAINAFTYDPLPAMARYVMHMHIHDGWFVNFADGSPKPYIWGGLLTRIGRRIEDVALERFGGLFDSSFFVEHGTLRTRLDGITMSPADAPKAPYPRDIWLPDTEQMVARDDTGWFVAAKGGHNDESHNHNDVGSFIVVRHGEPVLIDPGVQTYTKATFSQHRYEIWTMQSAFHNLPTVGGMQQGAGAAFRASDVTYESGKFALDLAGAYPADAGIQSWRRTITLIRGKGVDITDDYVLAEPREVELTCMTARDVGESDGTLTLGDIELTCDPLCPVTVEAVEITDHALRSIWTSGLRRIRFRVPASTQARVTVRLR